MRDEQYLCTGIAKGHGGRCERYRLRGSDRCKAHPHHSEGISAGVVTVKVSKTVTKIGGEPDLDAGWPNLDFTVESLLAEIGTEMIGFERK